VKHHNRPLCYSRRKIATLPACGGKKLAKPRQNSRILFWTIAVS
jgi:hypothetical protein